MNENLKKLYNGLVEDGAYTKSFETFKTQMKDPDYREFLFKGITEDGDFTQNFTKFESLYTPEETRVSGKEESDKDPFALGVTDFYKYGDNNNVYYKHDGKEYKYDGELLSRDPNYAEDLDARLTALSQGKMPEEDYIFPENENFINKVDANTGQVTQMPVKTIRKEIPYNIDYVDKKEKTKEKETEEEESKVSEYFVDGNIDEYPDKDFLPFQDFNLTKDRQLAKKLTEKHGENFKFEQDKNQSIIIITLWKFRNNLLK